LVAGTINHRIATFCKRNVVSGIIWLFVNFISGWLIARIPALESNFALIFMIVPVASLFISIGYYIVKNNIFTDFLKRA
jgi:membrane protein DedA with SNARE-associated domain